MWSYYLLIDRILLLTGIVLLFYFDCHKIMVNFMTEEYFAVEMFGHYLGRFFALTQLE